ALEALACQNAELIELLRAESGLAVEEFLADGGAAANDLLLQLSADFARARVRRPASVAATARGAALLAGLGAGVWSDPEQPAGLRDGTREFLPTLDEPARSARLADWRAAVARARTRT
ncbi:MAG: FGGY-family carbohydrate kinase, partial [Planctomycetota bacterium]